MKWLLPTFFGLAAGLVFGTPPTFAQTSAPAEIVDANDTPTTEPGDLDKDDPPRGPGARWRGQVARPFGGLGLLALSRQMFRPLPEDFDPLRPGEGDELMAFAKEHFPSLHDALAQLQERNPDRFRQRLEDSAPRLRHIKRLYERSPKMGGLIRRHVENMMRVQRDVRTLRAAAEGSREYADARQSIHDRLTDNVRLEIAAMENLIESGQRERDTRTEQRADALLKSDAPTAHLPTKLRNLVSAYHAADDGARTDARARLVKALQQIVDDELASVRKRVDDLRTNIDREVDQRLERLLTDRPRDPNHPPRPADAPRRSRP